REVTGERGGRRLRGPADPDPPANPPLPAAPRPRPRHPPPPRPPPPDPAEPGPPPPPPPRPPPPPVRPRRRGRPPPPPPPRTALRAGASLARPSRYAVRRRRAAGRRAVEKGCRAGGCLRQRRGSPQPRRQEGGDGLEPRRPASAVRRGRSPARFARAALVRI